MPVSLPEQHINLSRLRGSIALAGCCVPAPAKEQAANQAAGAMPLAHATNEKNFDAVLASGALLSRDARGVPPRRADIALGTTDDVCFYLGSAAFPKQEFGFLFSSALTANLPVPATATPFDSGGCVRKYSMPSGMTGPAQVKAHTMPVPECRDYLRDLLHTHFVNPGAYLAGREFACPVCGKALPDPHGMVAIDEHALVRMHEVRIPGRVDLKHPQLVAVFLPENLAPPSLAPFHAAGVRLIRYEKPDGKDRTRALRLASIDFILSELFS